MVVPFAILNPQAAAVALPSVTREGSTSHLPTNLDDATRIYGLCCLVGERTGRRGRVRRWLGIDVGRRLLFRGKKWLVYCTPVKGFQKWVVTLCFEACIGEIDWFGLSSSDPELWLDKVLFLLFLGFGRFPHDC